MAVLCRVKENLRASRHNLGKSCRLAFFLALTRHIL